jgi:hypothetical protein
MRHATSGSSDRRIDLYRCSKTEGGCGRISANVAGVDQVAAERLIDFLAACRVESVATVESAPVLRALDEDRAEVAKLCRDRYVERIVPDDVSASCARNWSGASPAASSSWPPSSAGPPRLRYTPPTYRSATATP